MTAATVDIHEVPDDLQPDTLLTLRQVGKVLGLSYAGARRLVVEEREFGFRIGYWWFATAEEVELYRRKALNANKLIRSGQKRVAPADPIVDLPKRRRRGGRARVGA